jgi:NTP pyrophosphatase (non-canonical NTP hydrolase)
MNIDDFQKQALKSIAISQKGPIALSHRTLGLNGAAGTLANQLKKVIRDKEGVSDEEDLEVVKKRLGDVLYYTAALAEYFDLSLSDIATQNVARSDKFLKDRQNSKGKAAE